MKPAHISIILVAPENVDNIGAAARAIKNMGFSDFRLVKPPRLWQKKGKKMAMAAGDILSKARVFPSLKEAVRNLNFTIGTTRRSGGKRGLFLEFSEMITMVCQKSNHQKIGLVFGCESKGLSNPDLQLCNYAVMIPASDAYPSLNLAQAVMVVLFSLYKGRKQESVGQRKEELFLNKKETDITLGHFEKALRALDYKKKGANLLPRIFHTTQGLLKRSGLLPKEAQMIKGLSRRICEKVLSCQAVKGKITAKESRCHG